MKYSQSIKPISYFKTHMAQVIRELNEGQGHMVITQNGEAKAVVIDVRAFEPANHCKVLPYYLPNFRK